MHNRKFSLVLYEIFPLLLFHTKNLKNFLIFTLFLSAAFFRCTVYETKISNKKMTDYRDNQGSSEDYERYYDKLYASKEYKDSNAAAIALRVALNPTNSLIEGCKAGSLAVVEEALRQNGHWLKTDVRVKVNGWQSSVDQHSVERFDRTPLQHALSGLRAAAETQQTAAKEERHAVREAGETKAKALGISYKEYLIQEAGKKKAKAVATQAAAQLHVRKNQGKTVRLTSQQGESKGEEQLEEQGRKVYTRDLEEALAALHDPTVTTLSVRHAKFGDKGIEKIAEGLQHENCRVTDLDLNGNKIGAKGMEHLVRALQHKNCRVTNLELGGNGINQSVLDRIQPFLTANVEKAAAREEAKKKQEEKVMQEKKLEDALAALRDPTVTTLVVSWMNFGAEDVEKIAEGLQHKNCHVTNLSLWGNKIGDEGVEHLSRALQHENCRVTNLDLVNNEFGLRDKNIDQSVLDRLQTFLDANVEKAAVHEKIKMYKKEQIQKTRNRVGGKTEWKKMIWSERLACLLEDYPVEDDLLSQEESKGEEQLEEQERECKTEDLHVDLVEETLCAQFKSIIVRLLQEPDLVIDMTPPHENEDIYALLISHPRCGVNVSLHLMSALNPTKFSLLVRERYPTR